MSRCFLSLFAVLSFSLALAGADWPRFRGPNGTGIAQGTLPAIDPKAALWKVAIPGNGHSSPIIANGRLFLQTAADDGSKRVVYCLDAATGKTLWTKDTFGKPAHTHKLNSLASGTPAADAERVYFTSWDGDTIALVAYDHAGTELWKQPLGGFVSQHGPGHSPMVYRDTVYISIDEDADLPVKIDKKDLVLHGTAMLYAFDAKTGKKKWAVPRKPYRSSYSTPFMLERPNKPAELVLGTSTAITGYDPESGKALWSHAIEWQAGTQPLRVVGSPVFADGVIICYCGDGGGARYAIAISPDSETPAKVWEVKKGPTPYVPAMIARGDLLFWIADNNVPCCAEARTGKLIWNEERLSGKDVTASPILVGDEMLVITVSGQAFVLKADKKFDLIRQENLGEDVSASPAMADGRLYIRGAKHLYCFGKK